MKTRTLAEMPPCLWVIQEFGYGLIEYHNGLVPDPDGKGLERVHGPSLEQRLGIRSSKVGGHLETDKEETVNNNRKIALEVAQMIGPNPKYGDVEKAIQVVKTKRNISESSVLKAWGEHGDIDGIRQSVTGYGTSRTRSPNTVKNFYRFFH